MGWCQASDQEAFGAVVVQNLRMSVTYDVLTSPTLPLRSPRVLLLYTVQVFRG